MVRLCGRDLRDQRWGGYRNQGVKYFRSRGWGAGAEMGCRSQDWVSGAEMGCRNIDGMQEQIGVQE